MSKYLIKNMKIGEQVVDLFAQADSIDVSYTFIGPNGISETKSLKEVVDQISKDIDKLQSDIDQIEIGGSTVIQDIKYGGTGADNVIDANKNLMSLFLGSIPWGIDSLSVVNENSINYALPDGTYRYQTVADMWVTVHIHPVDLYTGEPLDMEPFLLSVPPYCIVSINCMEEGDSSRSLRYNSDLIGEYVAFLWEETLYATIEGYEISEVTEIVVPVFTEDVDINLPVRKMEGLTYAVYWFAQSEDNPNDFVLANFKHPNPEIRGGDGFTFGQLVSVTEEDKHSVDGYVFIERHPDNKVSCLLDSDENANILQLYFKLDDSGTSTGTSYSMHYYNVGTGAEFVGETTGKNSNGTSSIIQIPQEINNAVPNTIVTANFFTEFVFNGNTWNYVSTDERNVTTLTLSENAEENVFKGYYRQAPSPASEIESYSVPAYPEVGYGNADLIEGKLIVMSQDRGEHGGNDSVQTQLFIGRVYDYDTGSEVFDIRVRFLYNKYEFMTPESPCDGVLWTSLLESQLSEVPAEIITGQISAAQLGDIPVSKLTGTLPVDKGGTGVGSLGMFKYNLDKVSYNLPLYQEDPIDFNRINWGTNLSNSFEQGVQQKLYHTPMGTTETVTWYNVQTFGADTRITQIASLPFMHQWSMYVRFKHDVTWSPWFNMLASNENLLTNWDFSNPVNQRDELNLTIPAGSHRYILDRWILWNNSRNNKIISGYLANNTVHGTCLNCQFADGYCILEQVLPVVPGSIKGVLTFSVIFVGISYASLTRDMRDIYLEVIYLDKNAATIAINQSYCSDIEAMSFLNGNKNACLVKCTLDVPARYDENLENTDPIHTLRCRIVSTENAALTSVRIKAAKLEKGEVSTLMLDPFGLSYEKELEKCQRYYYRISGGLNSPFYALANFSKWNDTTGFPVIYLPVTMVKTPRISYNQLYAQDRTTGVHHSINAVITQRDNLRNLSTIELRVDVTDGTPLQESNLLCLNGEAAFIAFDAEYFE